MTCAFADPEETKKGDDTSLKPSAGAEPAAAPVSETAPSSASRDVEPIAAGTLSKTTYSLSGE